MSSAAAQPVSRAQVTVSAFDVHLWSRPFAAADFDPNIHFLWSPTEYRKMRDAGDKIALGDLMLFPLKDELCEPRNHFWSRYKLAIEKISTGPATPLGDSREFLWPLRCRPLNLKLLFGASRANTPPNVWATIWLWPFGWSSTIEFKVTSSFSLDDLQDLGVKLRDRSSPPFILNGHALPLSEVFRSLTAKVRQSMGAPGSALSDTLFLSRHVVVSLQLPRGMQPRGAGAGSPEGPGWPAADRLRMLGALRGREVTLGELREQTKFLFTPLGDRNFAYTDFDEGTLLVLRHWKDLPGATRETNHCLFANVRAFSVVYFALQRFITYANRQSNSDGTVTNAKQMLASLPKEYRNGLARNFGSHFSPSS